MRTEDLRRLGMRLGQLAEAFDRKAPSENAMLVWLDVLKEFSLFEVESMLVDMPKRLTKFPSPADVWKACNERRSDRIENEARALAREELPRITQFVTATRVGRLELPKIKAILAKPRPTKRAWIDKIFKHHEDGDPKLCAYSVKLANEAQAAFSRRGGYVPERETEIV